MKRSHGDSILLSFILLIFSPTYRMTLAVAANIPQKSYYAYPIPNDELIKELKLVQHIEGGYFAETDRQKEQIPSPFAGAKSLMFSSSRV